MRAWIKFYTLLLILAAAAVVVSSGCGKAAPVYRSKLHGTDVVVFTKDNAKSLLSVHADKTKVLQIGSIQFENIRGFGCGFVEIVELKTLVFVNDENGAAFIHAFDMSKHVDRKAPLGDASGFGYWLGTTNTQDQAVTMLTSNSLLLSIQGPSYPDRKLTRWEFTFDLDQKSVQRSNTKQL